MRKISDLSDNGFEEIAAINEKELVDILCLKNDCCAYISTDKEICFKCPTSKLEKATFDESYNDFADGLPFPQSDTYKLHSKPDSPNKIFLDFVGGTLRGTFWNDEFGLDKISYTSLFIGNSTLTKSRIQKIWKGVAEDFAPFDVDVTTESTSNYNVKCIITNKPANEIFGDEDEVEEEDNEEEDNEDDDRDNYGGLAVLNSWNKSRSNKCWCFYPNSWSLDTAIQTISHEVGHTLGLLHQGVKDVAEYYEGFGEWGPIMGAAFTQSMTQWAYVPPDETYTGTETEPSRNQNDLALINKKIPYVPRDYPSSIRLAARTEAITTRNVNTYYGIISKSTEGDFFKFSSGKGNISIKGTVSVTDPNLNLQLTLYDESYDEVKKGAKIGLNSTINYNLSERGTYYIKVDGVGSTFYTDYASIGKYKLVFNLQPYFNYMITPNKRNIYRGEEITFNVSTINILDNTTIYWKNIGTSDPTEFVENTDSGSIEINDNEGTLVLTSINNFPDTSEKKTIKIVLYSDSTFSRIIATAETVYLNDNIYSIVPNKKFINEGDEIIFNVTATNISPVYWKNVGTTAESDFNQNVSSGRLVLNNHTGSFSLKSIIDSELTETIETIIIELYSNNTFTNLIATSPIIELFNASVDIVPNKNNIFEGDKIIFNITTTNISNNTPLYWKNFGSTFPSNFLENKDSGSVLVNNNSASIVLTSKTNSVYTENQDSIQIEIFTNSTFTNKIAESSIVYLNKIKITPNKTNIFESEGVEFTINTYNVPDGTNIYWKNIGTSAANDFNENLVSGQVTINNNMGSILLTSLTDLQNESRETIIMRLYGDKSYINTIANSAIVYLNNITIKSQYVNVYEGDNIVFNITTDSIPNNTKLYWNNYGTGDNTMFEQPLNGTVIINNNVASIKLKFKIGIITEQQTLIIKLFTDEEYKNKVAESNIVYLNKIDYTIIPRKTSVNEGSSVIYDVTTNDNVISLYWKNIGTATANNFENGMNEGILSISNKKGLIILPIKNNNKFEENKTIIIQLSKVQNGDPLAASESININEISVPPVLISSIPSSTVTEGGVVTFTISTNTDDGYKLYWTNDGTTDIDDFVENISSGELIFINNNATLVLTTQPDLTIESYETIKINVRKDSITGPILATKTVSISGNTRRITPLSIKHKPKIFRTFK